MRALTPLAILALMPFASPAAAQNAGEPFMILRCRTGVGCYSAPSQLSTPEVRALTGKPNGRTLVYRNDNEVGIISPLSAEDVSSVYGERLIPVDAHLEPFKDAPAKDVFEDGDGKPREIDLFPEEPGQAAMAPKDGLWRITSVGQDFEGCNPGIAQALASQASTVPSQTHQLNWGGRFDPAVTNFLNAEGQRLEWTKVSARKYTGLLFAVTGDAASVSTDVSMEMISPELIKATSLLDINSLIPDAAGRAELAALGFLDCKITMHFDMTLVE